MDRDASHLNGNLRCAVALSTTGYSTDKHEIYELAIIPITQDLKRDSGRKLLDLQLKTHRPPDPTFGHMKVKRIRDANSRGVEPDTARDIFLHWFEAQKLGRCKIIPVAHNYVAEARFLRAWLGDLHYDECFMDEETRDVLTMVRFINDMADFRDTEFPYRKWKLSGIALRLGVETDYGPNVALSRAAILVDVYRRLQEEFNKQMLYV